MKNSIYLTALLAALGLSACDKPTVVNVPPTPAEPGPPTSSSGSPDTVTPPDNRSSSPSGSSTSGADTRGTGSNSGNSQPASP
jgi:hypothetical protein